MFSTPLIASSIGVATVSAMTFGLAPGKFARTTTCGGATSGYSEIGITRMARRPARKISTDSTPAKIGRSIKNLDRFILFSEGRLSRSAIGGVGLRLRPRIHRDLLRCDQRARPYALQSVDDDVLAWLQPGPDDPHAVDERPECHLAILGLVVGADDQHELLVLVGADRALIDHHRWLGFDLPHAKAGELPGHQAALRIGERGAHPHGAAACIDLIVDELELAFVGRAIARGGDHLHRDAV